MTLQQIYYLLTIEESGSMNKAAEKLFVVQPSLTSVVKEVEAEIGIPIFLRTHKGVIPTTEGREFLVRLRALYQQYEDIVRSYGENGTFRRKFSVSMQHYSFAVKAFIEMTKHFDTSQYDLALRETRTVKVIRDVGSLKSEIGILYISEQNRRVLQKLLREQELEFHTLIKCPACVFLAKSHPLAGEKELSIRQIRGFYNAADGKLKLLRIEAVERPTPLPYEQAREKALADFRREREANALQIAAEKIYKDMQEALTTQGLQSALAIAQKAGALVEDFGPVQLFRPTSVLPSGVSDADIMGTPSGKMTPLVVQPTGARFTCITGRTVEDSPSITMQKRLFELPRLNAQLRHSMMQEWQNAAYNRFDVQLAPTIRTMEKED